jgi:predicted transcriptional regulator
MPNASWRTCAKRWPTRSSPTTRRRISDLRLTASNAPALARAFLELHRAYRETHERLASLDEALGREEAGAPLPWEEVRDFFHYCDNYIDAVDRAAERFADDGRTGPYTAIAIWPRPRLARSAFEDGRRPLRVFDRQGAAADAFGPRPSPRPALSALAPVALLTQDELLEATLDLARFQSGEARAIAKIGLANYFAGAALHALHRLPQAAEDAPATISNASPTFSARRSSRSAHRLSTLQRPGAKGVPFFFVRVDQAGTITKRHSATRLQFARFGGACPLWNVHPRLRDARPLPAAAGRNPRGVRYICLARDVSKPGGSFGAPVRRFAIALGCEIAMPTRLVYADDLDLTNARRSSPSASPAASASAPPATSVRSRRSNAACTVDPDERDVLPYRVG